MMTRPPVWVVELAARFWERIPQPAPAFPRDLAAVLAYIRHIRVTELPHLTVGRATAFLKRAGFPFRADIPERPLRGCLAAFEGKGFILVATDDDPAERRFTVAHELAHFLRDYAEPRRRAESRLGPGVREVFDGLRPATADERLAGFLRGVTLGCHTHLLGRDDRGRAESAGVREAEAAADRLAFELLAPFDAVAAGPVDPASLADRLAAEFGLPPRQATEYAADVLPRISHEPSRL